MSVIFKVKVNYISNCTKLTIL